MIGTMLGVLFVCLIGTVPIAMSLGLSCVATFALGGGGNMNSDAGPVHGDQHGFVFFDGNSVFYVGRKLEGVWRNRKKAG